MPLTLSVGAIHYTGRHQEESTLARPEALHDCRFTNKIEQTWGMCLFTTTTIALTSCGQFAHYYHKSGNTIQLLFKYIMKEWIIIPNITTTKLEFTSVTTIDAIIVKFFDLSNIDDTERPPAVTILCLGATAI